MPERQPELPQRGERVLIRWPGGQYDFEIKFERLDSGMPAAAEGWYWLRGLVVKPDGPQHRAIRTFYAKPSAAGGYEMLPKQQPSPRD